MRSNITNKQLSDYFKNLAEDGFFDGVAMSQELDKLSELRLSLLAKAKDIPEWVGLCINKENGYGLPKPEEVKVAEVILRSRDVHPKPSRLPE